MALDEPQEEMNVYSENDLTIIADNQMKTMIEMYGGIEVDFVNHPTMGTGFSVKFASASSCSSGSCSSGGCG